MNLERFQSTTFKARTATVPVPGLSVFFDEGQAPEITVRGLTGTEVARARERMRENAVLAEVVAKLVSNRAGEQVDGIKDALGLSGGVPADMVYRIAVLEFGVVGMPMKQSDVVKLAEAAPEAFYQLSSKIIELTGLGQVPLGE